MASMLSYRHAFHAGNHADVLKHALLSRIAIGLLAKDKPFSYIDTHAGAGIYSLDDEWAQKTGEAARGIARLLESEDLPPLLAPYRDLCADFFRTGHRYPGSPAIVRSFAREQDQLTLLELHPTEIENLRANLLGDERVHIHHRDGYSGVLALSPPTPRRGFALMDPSYETADDYARTAETMIALHRRWPVGILALWYPIVARRDGELSLLKERFAAAGIPGILTAELRVREEAEAPADGQESTEGYGLLGSGMLVINPPWKLEAELSSFLPWLADRFGINGQGRATLEWLNPPQ
ncbi:MAG TPA: 23S rRNA (adenine(2030)-N(6))-methyltransferase RlmJ [Treponemataceae bacterium]|nr:23S rRNA (adenine(2030)-N(6))-methyltransferase RlmJ [Treponemataceae bacterium]